MDDEQFEETIIELSAGFMYPPTPDITDGVARRLRPASVPNRRLVWAAGVTAVGLLLVFLVITPVRAAVWDWLRVGAIRIFTTDVTPTPVSAPEAGALIDLGTAASLVEANAIFSEPIVLPSDLGEPDWVYVQAFVQMEPMVTFIWVETVERPQIMLSLIAVPYLGTKWARGEQVQQTAVKGSTAVWIEGPHLLHLESGDFSTVFVETNVLIWSMADVTYRLEGMLSQEEAVKLAESLE